jgi:hypothetical protein
MTKPVLLVCNQVNFVPDLKILVLENFVWDTNFPKDSQNSIPLVIGLWVGDITDVDQKVRKMDLL